MMDILFIGFLILVAFIVFICICGCVGEDAAESERHNRPVTDGESDMTYAQEDRDHAEQDHY